MKMNFIDLKEDNQVVKDNILKKISSAIDGGFFINSPYHLEFEINFSKWVKSLSEKNSYQNYVIGVSSGTSALEVSLRAMGVSVGDEVIVPATGWVSNLSSILSVGAKPIFCDVQAHSLNLDYIEVEKKITTKTKAIVAIHMYGNVCDLDNIYKFDIPVLEDCSHAHGSTYKGHSVSVGGEDRIGIFSCYPAKTFGAMGDAGIIATTSKKYEESIRSMIDQGRPNYTKYPMNARMNVFQSIVLNEKLKYLDTYIQKRKNIMKIYDDNLPYDTFNQIKSFGREGCSPHLYVISPENSEDCKAILSSNNIGYSTHYDFSLHKLNFYKKSENENYPNSEKMRNRVISLPLYPSMPIEDVYRVCEVLNGEL